MKIQVPSDHQPAFAKALALALLLEQGKFAEAFDLVGFTAEAHKASKQWRTDLEFRRAILQRCETRLMIGGYKPEPELLDRLNRLAGQIESNADFEIELPTPVDIQALAVALETYVRLSLGKIDDVLSPFTTLQNKPGIRPQDGGLIDEMLHLSVAQCPAAFSIGNELVSDDARNAWNAVKAIQYHESLRQPSRYPSEPRRHFKTLPSSPMDILVEDDDQQLLTDYSKAFQTLRDFETLEDGWDGVDSRPASIATTDACEKALYAARAVGASRPSLTLSGNGAVSVVWNSKSHYATLKFNGAETYSIIVLKGGEAVLSVSSPVGHMPIIFKNFLVEHFDGRKACSIHGCLNSHLLQIPGRA